jgi:hypothetical protein
MAELLDSYRQQYPAYKDVDDTTLANGIYNKYYAGKIDRAAFDQKIGLSSAPKQEDPNIAQSAYQAANVASRGFVDNIGGTLAAIPELMASGMRYVGLPAPQKGAYQQAMQSGIDYVDNLLPSIVGQEDYSKVTGAYNPNSTLNKAAYGAGDALGSAATFLTPAVVAGKTAQLGSMTQRVGQAAATQPGMQLAAAGVGGAVGGATDNPLLGLAASLATPVAGAAARRAAAPITNRLSAEEQRLAALAEQYGIKLTPGQVTGSPALRKAEQLLSQFPISGPKQQAIYDAQKGAFNKAVLSRAGIDSDSATPEVLSKAFKDIGKQFDDIAAQTQIVVDPKFSQDIASVANDYGRRLPSDIAPVFQSYMDDLTSAVNAARQPGVTQVTIDGRTYQNIASDVRRAARNASNRPDLQVALNGLASSLDDAMERSVGPGLRSSLQETRRQYRNLLMIDKAKAGGAVGDKVSGDIPFSAFSNSVKSGDKRGFARGRGEMNDLSRVGNFLQSAIPKDSGTPAGNTIAGLLTGAGGGVGYGALTGEPLTAAASAIGAFAIPPAVQAFINSPAGRSYLTRQLAPQNGQISGALAKILAAQGPNQITQ